MKRPQGSPVMRRVRLENDHEFIEFDSVKEAAEWLAVTDACVHQASSRKGTARGWSVKKLNLIKNR